MSRRAAGALVAAALVLLLFGLWRILRTPGPTAELPAATAAQSAAAATGTATTEVLQRTVSLWLPGARGRISPLSVEIESAPTPKARVTALLVALLSAGPEAGATPLFTEPVELATALLGPDDTLYVDLRAVGGGVPPPAGSTLEMQRVYSLVHTVLRNEPEIRAVVLLWNGTQRTTFSGHVDTSRPLGLRPEMELEVE